MKLTLFKSAVIFLFLSIVFLTSGCASFVSSATSGVADNLAKSIANQDDLKTVESAIPAYLIMIDGFIEGDQDNPELLMSAARLYSTFNGAFVTDEVRAKKLAQKSFDYASKAICIELSDLCGARQLKIEDLNKRLIEVDNDDQSLIYDFATAWAGWIQVNADDWNALADLPRITALLTRSVEIDESYDNGGAHLYLGVLNSQLPPALGGKPEIGLNHFKKANAISDNKNLMVNVLQAQHYARLIFDQELHDNLLNQVLADNNKYDGLILINTLAKYRAEILLAESPEFF